MASEEPVRMLESEPSSFELTELEAPDEELLGSFLPIGDVAKLIGVNPSVLRFWEQEFPQLRPTKRGNRRYYGSEDVALIRTIQHLLYEEHYTILGARNKIHELQVQDKAREILDDKAGSPLPVVETKKVVVQTDMSPILEELRAIRALLTAQNQPQSKTQASVFEFDQAQEEAVANFSLVSEDLRVIAAYDAHAKNEETVLETQKSQETDEEMLAPHTFDLGAFGADSDNAQKESLTVQEEIANQAVSEIADEGLETSVTEVEQMPSLMESISTSGMQELEQSEVTAETIEPKTELSVDAFLNNDKPLPTPAMSSSEQAKVHQEPKQPTAANQTDKPRLAVPPLPGQKPTFTIGMKVPKSQQQSLTHIAPFLWNKK